jgi:hypothetical protein
LTRFVPAPGKTANVSLNHLSALNPCPSNNCWYSGSSKQAAPWRNWNGAAWAPEYSPYGALIFNGGGHGGGEDIGLTVFDFTTGLWSRVGPDNASADLAGRTLPEWDDFLLNGDYIIQGVHTYNYPSYIPPNMSGTGAKGSWVLPQQVTGKGGATPHAVDLVTGRWTRFAQAPGSTGQSPYAGAFYDSRRGRLWWGCQEVGQLNMMDWNESHPRKIHVVPNTPKGSIFAYGGYYANYVYVPEADLTVGFWTLYGQKKVLGEVFNMASGQPVRVASGNWPALDVDRGAGFGIDWCPDTRKFYMYEGYGSTKVRTLTPSSLDFSTCTWVWGEEVFSNPAWEPERYVGEYRQGAQPFSKWRYIRWLKCFAWSDGPDFIARCADGVERDGVMQLWRPLGT